LLVAGWAVVLCLFPVAPASADWSAPERLTRAGTSANGVQLIHTSVGETVTAWVEQSNEDPFPMRLAVAVKRAGEPLEEVQILADQLAGCVLDIAADAAGNVLIAWQLPDGTIRVARRPPGGEFSAPETLRKGSGEVYGSASAPRLSMNESGDALVTWTDWYSYYELRRQDPRRDAMAAISRDGGPFEPAVKLTEAPGDGSWSHDSVITATSEVVFLWAETYEEATDPGWRLTAPSRVRAVWRSAEGVNSDVQTLVTTDNFVSCPRVATDGAGRVATIWHEVEPVQCLSGGFYKLARRLAGEAFAEPTVVPGSSNSAAGGALELDASGNISIAFDNFDDPPGIRVVTGPFDGELSLAHIRGGVAGIAATPDGTVIGRFPHPFAWRTPMEVGRLGSNGTFEEATDVRDDCAPVEWADVSATTAGTAVAMGLPNGVTELAVDRRDGGGTRRCIPPEDGAPPAEPPPRGGPPRAPPPTSWEELPPRATPDKRAPVLHLAVTRLRRALSRGRLEVALRANEPSKFKLRARLKARGFRSLTRAITSDPVSGASGATRLRYKVRARVRRLLRAAARSRTRAHVAVAASATDAAGNVRSLRRRVRLR
jgi:hypothetical protein